MKRFYPIFAILIALVLGIATAQPTAAAQQIKGVSGKIARQGDTLVYPVEVGFGHALYAVVNQAEGSRLDPYLRLYDRPDPGAEPIWEDDDSFGGLDPYIFLWPLMPGRYYLEVSGVGTTTGEFTMMYGAFHPWGNAINTPNAYDTHSFYGRKDDIFWVQTLRPEDSTLDPYIVVEAPDGKRTRFNSSIFGGPDVGIDISLRMSGRYKIYVSGERGTVGDYTLLIVGSDE